MLYPFDKTILESPIPTLAVRLRLEVVQCGMERMHVPEFSSQLTYFMYLHISHRCKRLVQDSLCADATLILS